MMNGFAGCGGWYGSIFGILILGLIVWGVFYMINQSRRNGPSSGYQNQGPSALEILKARYARGEISQAEFERMKKELL